MMILGLPDEDEQRLLKISQAYFGGGNLEILSRRRSTLSSISRMWPPTVDASRATMSLR
jgi:hypothetical protein